MLKFRINKAHFIAAVATLAVLAVLAFILPTRQGSAYEKVGYPSFISMAEDGAIASVVLSESPKLTAETTDNRHIETDNPRSATFKEEMLKLGVDVEEGSYTSEKQMLQTALSVALIVAVVVIGAKTLSKRGIGISGGMDITDGSATTKTTFRDVAGNAEAKESVRDIIDFLENPDKYARFGARMPRGILFYGQPGTGKTLLARAIAGEAGVPFYAVSGSDFVQMYVGVGAGRVRDLFKKAREGGRAVIFIDEIDALAKKRQTAAVGGNDERDQTLNALLTEMSGFSSTDGVIVIAATNRLDTLDEAILRPGRFDRQLEVTLPDVNARKEILALYAKDKPLHDIDINAVAKTTVYFSGAMLENLLNEAAIFAAKGDEPYITQQHVDKAYYEVIAGGEKKDRSAIRDRDRNVTAFHESGHALAAKLLSPDNSVQRVTIIPSTKGAGGFCLNIPPESMYITKRDIESKIVVSLAGRAAEELVFGQDGITTGASNDLEKASSLIGEYISKYAMSDNVSDNKERSALMYVKATENGGNNEFFREHAAQMERFYLRAKTVIEHNREKLNALAAALLQQESLDEDEVNAVLGLQKEAA